MKRTASWLAVLLLLAGLISCAETLEEEGDYQVVALSAASDQTCEFFYPVGDTNRPHAAAFRDIVRGEIELQGETFFLRMELAGSVPLSPRLPPGVREMWWYWPLDLDRLPWPEGYPAGYPFAPGVGIGRPAEFQVIVAWDGTVFTGNVIDRRPLQAGEDAIITPLSFRFIANADGNDRTIVEAELDSSLIDDPESFDWIPITRDWSGPRGSDGHHVVDHSIGPGDPWNPFPCPPPSPP